MTYQGYSSLLKAPPPRTTILCSTTITVLHLTHYLYPSLPSPTLPLCPSPPPRLATALCAQHLIKVMLNKTVSPACSLARPPLLPCMCAQCGGEANAGCVPAQTARLKASPWRPNAYASPLRLGNECGSPSNALQF